MPHEAQLPSYEEAEAAFKRLLNQVPSSPENNLDSLIVWAALEAAKCPPVLGRLIQRAALGEER